MSDVFVPLLPPKAKSRATDSAATGAEGVATPVAPATAGASTVECGGSEAHGKPIVTLQRNGDVISGIRVQCGCGAVVDLACVY